jgi:hypothetical protein
MLLATGVGSEVQRPLATVVVGGLFSLFMFFFPFDILFLYMLFSFENESSLLFCCIAMLVWRKNKTDKI